jgi:Fe-S-cluster containining protein
MNKVFPCNQCGACCKSIRLSTQTAWLDRGDGVCRNFNDAENTCTIYDNRPEICNVHLMYERHYQHQFTWDEFVQVNQKACDALVNRQA